MIALELTLIRHGRSVADDEDVIEGGGYDAPLSDTGRAQARLLAERLAGENYRPDILFASPLLRAREVAEIVGAKLGASVSLDARLAEQHLGRISRLTREEAARVHPLPPDGPRTYVPVPDGESLLDQQERVLRFYCELLDKHLADSVCVVAHGGTVGCLLRIIYGQPVRSAMIGRDMFRFVSGDTGVSRLVIDGPNCVTTRFLNDDSHLRGAGPRI